MRINLLMVLILMSKVCSAQVCFPFKQGKHYGYIDTGGNWIIQPNFDYASFFNGSKALANKGDSVFIISLKGKNKQVPEIQKVPEIKSFITLGIGIALLDKHGKWALSDTSMVAKTPHQFNRVDTCGGFFKVMNANNKWQLYDRFCKLSIQKSFDMLAAISSGLFLCRINNETYIYKQSGDSVNLLKSGEFVCKFVNPGFELFSKKIKKKIFLTANGDSMLSCNNCEIISSIANLKVIVDGNGYTLYNFNEGKIIAESKLDTGIVAYNSFYWVAEDSLFCKPGQAPIKVDEYIDGFLTTSDDYHIYFQENKWGVLGSDGVIKLRPNYEWIEPLENNVIRLYDQTSHLYDVTTSKVFKHLDFNADVGFMGSSWMVKYNDTTEILKYDSAYNLIDSNNYYKVKFMKAGMKTSDFNNNAGGNNSASNRYFYHREKYGLLSTKADTLIKAILLSVNRVNDSIDLVSLLNGNSVSIMNIDNHRLVCSRRYGLLNNRTGKFILKPDYFYISATEYKDTNYGVFRVLTRSRKFGLVSKSDLELNKSTICDYIPFPENGYFRLFNQLRIHLRIANKQTYRKEIGFDFDLLSNFNYFSTNNLGVQGRVIGYAKSVNLCNSKGEILLTETEAKKKLFIESGYNGTFVFNSTLDSAGVIDSTGHTIIKPSYRLIKRLKQDKRYFLLYTYDSKYGYLNKMGEEITFAKYKKAFNFNDGYAWCQFKDSMILLDSLGNESELGIKNSQVIDVSEGYTACRKKKGWVIMDIHGEIIGDEYYKRIQPFVNGTAAAQSKGGWGIIDVAGNWLLKPQYEMFEAETESAIVFKNNNKRFFYTRDGKPGEKQKVKGVLKPLGDDLFSELVGDQSKIYLKNGELYKKKKFSDGLLERNDTIFSISKRRVQVYYDTKRAMSLSHSGGYKSISKGSFEFIRTKSSRILGTDLFLIPESFKYLYPNVFGRSNSVFRLYHPRGRTYTVVNKNMVDCYRLNAFVLKNTFGGENGVNYYSLSDSLGNLHSDILFTNIKYVGSDLFAASYKNEYNVLVTGLMNRFGIWVVQPKFGDINGFNEGFASYSISNQFYFADSTGQLVTTLLLDEIKDSNGYLLLNSDTEMAWWHPKKGWLTKFED